MLFEDQMNAIYNYRENDVKEEDASKQKISLKIEDGVKTKNAQYFCLGDE